MVAQKGRDILLKISSGSPPENFLTIAGLRARSISLRADAIDATDSDSPQAWRELLAGAATKSAAIAGSGVFRDAESDVRVRAAFFSQSADVWRIILPDFGILEGRFVVSSLDYLGDHDGEARFSINLASAGILSFEAL